MKKIIFYILLYLKLIHSDSILSSDTSSIKYFPLNVGNYFSYLVTSRSGSSVDYYIQRGETTKDTLINNKKYFYLKNYPYDYADIWVRLDSNTGSLFKYDVTNSCPLYQFEVLLDSFAIGIHDTLGNCSLPFTCFDTSDVTVFNFYNSKNKSFVYYYLGGPGGPLQAKSFAKNFGMTSFGAGYTFGSINYALKGCRINGVIYGDTTSVIGIKNLSSEIPGSFELYQNYPNPFNPATNIKFDIRKNSNVTLAVYNALGSEVEILVNENLSAGSYEAIWNGINYPSGVYFYKLSANGNIAFVKKMILLK